MNTSIRNFFNEEDGITALEYGLLAAIVATLLVATFGPGIKLLFTNLLAALEAAVTTAT